MNGRLALLLASLCLALPSARGANFTILEECSPKVNLPKAELIKLAIELGTPFIKSALEKIQRDFFGNGRATWSTDVPIFNRMESTFRMLEANCKHGGFSSNGTNDTNLFPEHLMTPKASFVYGVESTGFGVECKVSYEEIVVSSGSEESTGRKIVLTTANPFVGSNWVSFEASSGIQIIPVLGCGMHNQVRFTIQKSTNGNPSGGAQQSSSTRHTLDIHGITFVLVVVISTFG